MKFEARRAGIKLGTSSTGRTYGAQSILFQLSTASRPWLFRDDPSDLASLLLDPNNRYFRISSRRLFGSVSQQRNDRAALCINQEKVRAISHDHQFRRRFDQRLGGPGKRSIDG